MLFRQSQIRSVKNDDLIYEPLLSNRQEENVVAIMAVVEFIFEYAEDFGRFDLETLYHGW
jgi:hypothetical protein